MGFDPLGWLGNAVTDIGAELGFNPHRVSENGMREFATQDTDRVLGNVPHADTPAMRARIAELAARGNFQNPYDNAMAGQARPEQVQALQALMAMARGGGEVSGLQNNLQQNQMFNAAARNARGTSVDNPAIMQAMGQLAAQRGQGQLNEQMGLLGAAGQSAGGLRGQDLGQFGANQGFGLQATGLNNNVNAAAHNMGNTLDVSGAQYDSQRNAMINAIYGNKIREMMGAGKAAANGLGTVLSLFGGPAGGAIGGVLK